MSKMNRGMTMIELMVVVAIVGILLSVAYPSYRDHVTKTGRSEAHANLLRMVDFEERYYIQNNAYASTAALAYTPKESAPNYAYAVVLGTPVNGYTVNATAGGTQSDDTQCAVISIDSTGTKAGTTAGVCWQ